MNSASLHFTHIFAKEKRKKKKAVLPCGGFQKSKFFLNFFFLFDFLFCRDSLEKKIQITGTARTCFFEYLEQIFGFFFILFFVKMFTPFVLMKWGFRGVQSGDVNKGVIFFFLLDDLDCARFDNVSL